MVVTSSGFVPDVTVTSAVEDGTVTVMTPALPPVADRVSLAVEEDKSEEVVASSEFAEGVAVTCAVEEGTVTVTTPALPFPPVADFVSEVCWLEASSVGVTVTWAVEEGTVTVTAFPASVPEVVELSTVELASVVESSSNEVWLGFVDEVTVDDDKNPVTVIIPSVASLVAEATGACVEICEVELPVDAMLLACALLLLAALVGPFLSLRLSAVALEEICEDVGEALDEDPVDPLVEVAEDTGEGDNPDGPNELRATV